METPLEGFGLEGNITCVELNLVGPRNLTYFVW